MQAPKLYTNECQKHGIQLLNNSAFGVALYKGVASAGISHDGV